MQPGPIEISQPLQASMIDMTTELQERAKQPGSALSGEQRHSVRAIADKIQNLANLAGSGSEVVLMKPDFTLGYVRMGCDQVNADGKSSPAAEQAAERLRAWLDGIGHSYHPAAAAGRGGHSAVRAMPGVCQSRGEAAHFRGSVPPRGKAPLDRVVSLPSGAKPR